MMVIKKVPSDLKAPVSTPVVELPIRMAQEAIRARSQITTRSETTATPKTNRIKSRPTKSRWKMGTPHQLFKTTAKRQRKTLRRRGKRENLNSRNRSKRRATQVTATMGCLWGVSRGRRELKTSEMQCWNGVLSLQPSPGKEWKVNGFYSFKMLTQKNIMWIFEF